MNPPEEALFTDRSLRHQGRRNARSGAIEKTAHPQGLRSLHSYQAPLSADVIIVVKMREQSFIAVCIPLQAFDAFFDQQTESGADLESFTSTRASVFEGHCELPG
jgi:hypothetical protein